MILQQRQKIGQSKGKRRVCLWNKKMITAGFSVGQGISIKASSSHITIRTDKAGKRRVSKVMNHGKVLPVIDLKETKSVSLSMLGEIGDGVLVNIEAGKITLQKA